MTQQRRREKLPRPFEHAAQRKCGDGARQRRRGELDEYRGPWTGGLEKVRRRWAGRAHGRQSRCSAKGPRGDSETSCEVSRRSRVLLQTSIHLRCAWPGLRQEVVPARHRGLREVIRGSPRTRVVCGIGARYVITVTASPRRLCGKCQTKRHGDTLPCRRGASALRT